ncbi:DNA recombination protein RmuC [Williamsia sp. CHRR-6]|uniref:DNA recombination protein RmuC n=1 Tax=Williamsia sp. CHRR-6 TaxID=2835871 RepID=UPI001BD91596|nr:DNA recombination protein RmuC [Williamsia sp. CHRR-6]MBT0565573.1 DNA recombination protein RmuC [Williamsia sp. CHRR-6]
MSIATLIALVVGLAVGFGAGWWVYATRTAAIRESHALVSQALAAASEDAARRQSGAIGSQVATIVGPLRDTLDRLQDDLRRAEHGRITSMAGLGEQVNGIRTSAAQLGAHTARLANALHTPQLRGRWGELHLQKVVEVAGLSRHCDFSTQQTTDSGRRPDLIVHLPGEREIVVDAKVPLQSYLEAVATDDSVAQRRLLGDHARALRAHVIALSGKDYWATVARSPEFTVLFVPSDTILEAACRADPDLIEFAFARNVVPTTPSSLVALLRTVALTWRQDAVARDAEQIHDLGRELYKRLATMTEHLDKLGSSIGRTVEQFNATIGTLESRVMVTARTFGDLDAFASSGESTPKAVREVSAHVRPVREHSV